MRITFSLCILLLINSFAFAQNSVSFKITEHHSNNPLPGVNVILEGTSIGAAADENGIAVIRNIPSGTCTIIFSFIGYHEEELTLTFPENSGETIEVELEPEAEELEEISVSSTRGSRLIQDEPTRVEVIAGEEIDEKISMDPSNISMMLNESTGIQVQQTSAASASSTFRIQGLDGRYTQLLKDGFPLYSGFSGSLSIMQVPPLDLRQVEIIKGSSSTLYGGGAIAGLINLVTKDPNPEGELSLLVNATSAGGLDLSGFYSRMFENTGFTVLASRNTQKAYDNNDDNFSDLPDIERYSLVPKFSLRLNDAHLIEIGGAFIEEDRKGGGMPAIKGDVSSPYSWVEQNKTSRYSGNISYSYTVSEVSRLILRHSTGWFKRNLTQPDYRFLGEQLSTFSEAVYSLTAGDVEWISGLNVITENFSDKRINTYNTSYNDLTYGAFTQASLDLDEVHSLEGGLRLDYNKDYDPFILPRISFLSKWSESITTRLGGGLGYKLPVIFTEAGEELAFRDILPVDRNSVNAERSYGANFDINYSTIIFESVTVSFNNLLFYTRINDPLLLFRTSGSDVYEYLSFPGHYDTRGIESNLKLTYGMAKLFTGWSYTDVEAHSGTLTEVPLTPKHRLGIVLILEDHDNFRVGLEAYYTGKQKLSSGTSVTDYWINGLMIEKHFEMFSLFLNFENFLDTRQSRYGAMYTGAPSNPEFVEIYAPTDGRIINGGIKLRL